MRLRARVSSEDALAAYTGGGSGSTFRVGYCFATGAGCSGTASAQIYAMVSRLVVTYTYDAATVNRTGTVRYPLESAAGVGSKTGNTVDCTMDTDCPKFSCSADIPEITSQLAQWFHVGAFVVSDTGIDFNWRAQVDGHASGPLTYWDEALNDNQGQDESAFSGLAGYANNTAQLLELEVNQGVKSFALGGETAVTYAYPAAAATRTKTASYPIGEVITANGQSTKSALIGPNVYLPETGKTIKKAWLRIATSTEGSDGNDTFSVTSKVGTRGRDGRHRPHPRRRLFGRSR